MKRITVLIAAVLAVSALAAFAGFDQYASKSYTTLLVPTPLGVTQTGATTNMLTMDGSETNAMPIVSTVPSATNYPTSGVDCIGLPGYGSLVFLLDTGKGAAGVLSASFSTCATTNGSYAAGTDVDGRSSWIVTNTSTIVRAKVKPNALSRYWRVTVTAANCTNATAAALLVTE